MLVTPVPEAKPYEPTPKERAAKDALYRRIDEKPVAVRLKVTEGDPVPAVDLDHPDEALAACLLMDALGTTHVAFVKGIISQIVSAGSKGQKVDEDGLNFMLSVMMGIEPKDEVEAMLSAQMAAVHMATMTQARRLSHVETIEQQDSAERTFNKLARTFTTQVEALKRYRTGGEQKVTVEHVTVNEGGQAIVGNIANGRGGGTRKTEGRSHEQAIAHASESPMHGDLETDEEALPGAGCEGQEGVPIPRGARGRAKGQA